MASYQISISQPKRAAARFVGSVRRSIQKAFDEEHHKSGITQSEIARRIGVHRSVIHRELQGKADITLGRVAELAWAMGWKPSLTLSPVTKPEGSNLDYSGNIKVDTKSTNTAILAAPLSTLQTH